MKITAKDNDTQKRIKKWMNFYGWNAYRLKKLTNLSDSTIRGLFKENREPSIPTLQKVCDAFGISLSEFFLDREVLPEEGSELWMVTKMWGQLDEEGKAAFKAMFYYAVKNKPGFKSRKPGKKTGKKRGDAAG